MTGPGLTGPSRLREGEKNYYRGAPQRISMVIHDRQRQFLSRRRGGPEMSGYDEQAATARRPRRSEQDDHRER